MRTYEFVVVHTAAAYDATRKRVVHQRFEVVREIHMREVAKGGRGFDDIGYNIYIEVDGTVRRGRPDRTPGAHTEKLNSRSLGVCCSGSGDHEPFNPAQLASLTTQIVAWQRLYRFPLVHVIGHRESPKFGAAPTLKTCPGKLVDMDDIRARVRAALEDEPPATRRGGGPAA